MRVTAYKTVEVECECEVSQDDIIAEFALRSHESSETYWRRLQPAIASMIRIFASIPDATIAAMPTGARALIRQKLMEEAARWNPEAKKSVPPNH